MIFCGAPRRRLPERGRIGIFNRSYYEEVLIVRVHPEILRGQGLPDGLVDEKTIWQERYRSIVDLENHLHRNGTRIVKFFLHLSKEEQRKRFLDRIDEPEKNWKFSLADIEERKCWNQYMQAYEACLSATSTTNCALVCRARRRQEERPADYFGDYSRYLQSAQNALPQNRCQAPAGIAVDPRAVGERRHCLRLNRVNPARTGGRRINSGISVALALSLPPMPGREAIVAATYIVVIFSILVQALTMGRLVRRLDLGATLAPPGQKL